MLAVGVRTAAHSAEPVERGRADAGGEVPVGAAAHRDRPQRRVPQPAGDPLRTAVEAHRLARFERGAVDPAAQQQAGARVDRCERAERGVDAELLGDVRGAGIDPDLRERRHGVRRGPGVQHRRHHGGARLRIAHLRDLQHLVGHLGRGVDALLRLDAGVGGATAHLELVDRDPLAGDLHRPVAAPALEHECRTGALRLGLDEGAGGERAEFLVAGDEQAHALERGVALLQGGQGVEGDEHAALHVVGAGTADDALDVGERQAADRAERPHGVVVADEDHAARALAEAPQHVRAALDGDDARSDAEQLGADAGEEVRRADERCRVRGRRFALDELLELTGESLQINGHDGWVLSGWGASPLYRPGSGNPRF